LVCKQVDAEVDEEFLPLAREYEGRVVLLRSGTFYQSSLKDFGTTIVDDYV
jgi:hypothetical protein